MCSDHPKISIIIPVYNVAAYLPKCLESLVNQTYDNIEIICVNDGSPDESAEILSNYAEQYPNLHVITQENKGVSAARNAGVAAAAGDYLMFVDGDDWVDPTMCETLMNTALDASADCVMCSHVKEWDDHSIANHVFNGDLNWNEAEVKDNFLRRLFGPVGEETRRPQDVDLMVSVWAQLFKSEVCDSVKFVNLEEIGTAEDCLYQMTVYVRCREFVYIDRPLYHYRKTNQESITTKWKPRLFECWENLYGRMERLIADNGYPPVYFEALSNRVLFGLIGLGLNEISADTSLLKKSARLNDILSQKRYRAAFAKLDMSFLPLHWKVFFVLAKLRMTLPLVMLLNVINYLRGAGGGYNYYEVTRYKVIVLPLDNSCTLAEGVA